MYRWGVKSGHKVAIAGLGGLGHFGKSPTSFSPSLDFLRFPPARNPPQTLDT